MTGIINIFPYIPRMRIDIGKIDEAWGRNKTRGERSLGNFDEDTITMAVNSVSLSNLEQDPDSGDLSFLIFSTTSSPFTEESGASKLAYVLGADSNCQTYDLNQSLNSGMASLNLGFTLLKSLPTDKKKGLILTADRRQSKEGSQLEKQIADGACAIEIGTENIIAKFIGFESRHDFGYETWQLNNQNFLQEIDGKFSSGVKIKNFQQTAHQLLDKSNLSPNEIRWFVLTDSNGKMQKIVGEKLGFSDGQFYESELDKKIGYTGVSAPFLHLNEVLLSSKEGDKILLLHSGSGTSGILLEVTNEIETFKNKNNLLQQLSKKIMIDNYNEWLIRKKGNNLDFEPYSTMVAMRREKENNLRLRGQKCKNCNIINFPQRNNCNYCNSTECFEWIWLKRTGAIFTFTHDYVFPGQISPMTMAVIDLDGGGRIFTQMTDHKSENVKIGDRVYLSFRKFHEGSSFPNYYWKAVPLKEKGGISND